MNSVKLTSRAAAATVALVAGYTSWNHIVEVASDVGEKGNVAPVLPLSIDGLIVVGTMAMIEDKRAGRRPRLSARVALGFGVVATLAANIASAEPTTTARLVAAVPAIAFLIAVEVLARTGKPVPASEPSELTGQPSELTGQPGQLPAGRPDNAVTEQVDNLSSPDAPGRKRHPTSQRRVELAHRRTPAASDKELADRLKLSTKTVARWRPPKPAEPATVNGQVPDLPALQDVPS